MPKLFTKKWIFSFLISFFITFITGFLIWNIFISPEDGVLNQILLGLKIFSASVSSDYVIDNITPETDSGQEDSNNQDLESDENLSVIQNSVIASPQSFQDQLDDIQEKLDIISQQLQELVAQQNDKLADENKILDEEPDDENDQDDDQNEDIVIYPKILISEVQIAGISDDKQEFVELYNPNNQDVDLTDWYLQRKTAGALSGSSSWSTYVSNNLFFGKKIYANGYLLIARTGYYSNLADIFTDNPVTNDNSFALKNPNGDISDELGFGNSSDAELSATQNPVNGQSIGRKVLSDGTEEETDNNSNDFEIDNPTPKAQNIAYTAPISGDGDGGGDGSTVYPKILISEVQILPIAQRFVELYNPNDCEVDLTKWYIFKNDSSFITKSVMSGKKILAGGYFLISRSDITADLTLADLTLTPNNSLAVKSPDGKISDEISFGAIDDSKSIGRKFLNGTEQDTDNDSVDFELDTPTPRAQNIAYVEPPPVLLKNILISEFQVEGETADDDYVELYNPNDETVYLKGWSIQKASITGGISRVKEFDSNAMILGKNYFLIVNNNASQKLLDLADMTCSGLKLSSEFAGGNTIYLVKKQDTITDGDDLDIVDKVGYGLAKDFEVLPALKPSAGQSTGRIWDEAPQEYKNTDNNNADFEIDEPTPRAQNIKWVEPPAPILESIEITAMPTKLSYIVGDALDISGLVVTGTYSDGSTKIETITLEDITGFDSTTAFSSEVLTITIAGIFTTYEISVVEASVTQLKIISPLQTILIGSPSGVFTVESQNAEGVITKVLTTTYVGLSSDSPTGLFSSAPSGGPCGSDWVKTRNITISKNTAHKSFCYKDSTQGTPTITVSATGLSSDFQIITVNAVAP